MRLLKITVETVDVEDDFPVENLPKHEDTEGKIVYMCNGDAYMSFTHDEDMYHFSINADLETLPPAYVFLMWATGQLYDVIALTKDIPILLAPLNSVARYLSPYIQQVYMMLKYTLSRQQEIKSHMVNMKKWDPMVFDPKQKWFSTD